MPRLRTPAILVMLCVALLAPIKASAANNIPPGTQNAINAIILPLMRQYGIGGMAIGIVDNGRIVVLNYGVASKSTGRRVDNDTLFELGSISKTFNATLATYAQANGSIALSDPASKYLAELRGSAFDHITLRDLGTYTAGGLPLQVPDQINNGTQLRAWLKTWKPAYETGKFRLYSNTSIGLFGLIAATAMQADYASLLQDRMFPALGLTHSFINIPDSEMANYAQGYEDDGTPIRMTKGVLWAQAYGVRTTAGDMARFIAINMGMFQTPLAWQQAVIATHTGYDQLQAGGMVQDLGWEQYNLPVSLAALQAGNSHKVASQPQPVKVFNPPMPPRKDVLLNKTGSTNGFAAYAAYIPAHQTGIILLANRNYPIPARVTAAYRIMGEIDSKLSKD